MLTTEYSIYLLAFVTSLESQTTTNLTVYATSAFKVHSLVATVLVVQGVVNGMLFSFILLVQRLQGALLRFYLFFFLMISYL